MWEVRIGSELIDEFAENSDAQAAARKLREQGKEDVRVIPTGSFVPTGPVDIDVLPLSMRNKAA